MKSRPLIVLLSLICKVSLLGQINYKQQTAYNSYYKAYSALNEYTYKAILCLEQYNTTIAHAKQGPLRLPELSCAEPIPGFYQENVTQNCVALPGNIATNLNNSLKLLYGRYEEILGLCRSLEAYTKLKDYEKDQFALAKSLIEQIQTSVNMLKREGNNLENELGKQISSQQNSNSTNNVVQARKFIYDALAAEKELLDLMFLNFTPDNFSDQLSIDALQEHVNNVDILLAKPKQHHDLPYPASFQYDRFINTFGKDMLAMKRRIINSYTSKEQNNDQYANRAFKDLISEYNNLVSIQNSFSDALSKQQLSLDFVHHGTSYCPHFRNNLTLKVAKNPKVVFQETDIAPLKLSPTTNKRSKELVSSLNHYVEFINEALRLNESIPRQLRQLNQTCNNLSEQGCEAIATKGFIYFNPISNYYHLPKAEYERAINDGRILQSQTQGSLSSQAKTIMDILKECDFWLADLSSYFNDKKFKTDCLKHGQEGLERLSVLFEALHQHKERLYQDLLKVYGSYPEPEPNNSWILSGNLLWQNTELCKSNLLTARRLLYHQGAQYRSSDSLNASLRKSIYNKYNYLKGIHELGKNNGHCPYARYDDVIADCQRYDTQSGDFIKALGAQPPDSTKAFESLLYAYNETQEDYNQFVMIAAGDAEGYSEQDKYNPAGKKLAYRYLLEQIRQPMYFRYKKPTLSIPQQDQKAPIDTTTSGGISNSIPLELLSMDGYAICHLVFLLDISYSMNQPDKLPLLKQDILKLVSVLRPNDKVSIVTFSNTSAIPLSSASAHSKDVKETLKKLKPSGGSNIIAGLNAATQLAKTSHMPQGNNRIILVTDGEFAIKDQTYQQIQSLAEADVQLSVFSFGRSDISPALQKLAQLGKGNYERIVPQDSELKLLIEAHGKKL